MYDQIYHISITNRVVPDQAALTRAARSGSALFAKNIKRRLYEVKG